MTRREKRRSKDVEGGYIAVPRWVFEHPSIGLDGRLPVPYDTSKRKVFSRLEATLDLLNETELRKRTRRIGKRKDMVTLLPGQFCAPRRFYAQRWNWSQWAVRDFLKMLCNIGLIYPHHQPPRPTTEGGTHTIGVYTVILPGIFDHLEGFPNLKRNSKGTATPPTAPPYLKQETIRKDNNSARLELESGLQSTNHTRH
jgi:hypothetical protein